MIKEITIKHLSGVAYSYTKVMDDGKAENFSFNSEGNPIKELNDILNENR